MAEDLNIRFSEEQYATKAEVKKALNCNLIEPIFKKINEYRNVYRKKVFVKNYTGLTFDVCFLKSINLKLENFKKEFEKFNEKYQRETNPLNKQNYVVNNILLFKEIYKDESLDRNFATTLIVNKFEFLGSDNEKKKISSYFKTLDFLRSKENEEVNEKFLLNLYRYYSNNNEENFRENEVVDPYEIVNLTSLEKGASPDRISDLILSLTEFLEKKEFDDLFKAIIVFFFINFVKPFGDRNKEISILLSRFILSKKYKDFALYIFPFEKLLVHFNEFEPMMDEAHKNLDLTYFVIKVLEILKIEVTENFIVNKTEEIPNKEETKSHSLPSHIRQVSDEEIEGKNYMAPKKNVESENFEKSFPNIVPQGRPLISGRKEIKNKEELNAIKKKFKFLLETNPSLRKAQAKFLASHCTMGRFYTIEDFRKSAGCVYETARTSMDSLAELGYYKKEQIKNKFVYTLIKEIKGD